MTQNNFKVMETVKELSLKKVTYQATKRYET